ncbi:T-box transcription factor TBX15 [Arapaima gigas]
MPNRTRLWSVDRPRPELPCFCSLIGRRSLARSFCPFLTGRGRRDGGRGRVLRASEKNKKKNLSRSENQSDGRREREQQRETPGGQQHEQLKKEKKEKKEEEEEEAGRRGTQSEARYPDLQLAARWTAARDRDRGRSSSRRSQRVAHGRPALIPRGSWERPPRDMSDRRRAAAALSSRAHAFSVEALIGSHKKRKLRAWDGKELGVPVESLAADGEGAAAHGLDVEPGA